MLLFCIFWYTLEQYWYFFWQKIEFQKIQISPIINLCFPFMNLETSLTRQFLFINSIFFCIQPVMSCRILCQNVIKFGEPIVILKQAILRAQAIFHQTRIILQTLSISKKETPRRTMLNKLKLNIFLAAGAIAYICQYCPVGKAIRVQQRTLLCQH